MTDSLLDKQEDLHRRAFQMMFRILIIFGLPAMVGYFLGDWVDTTFDVRPWGSVGVLIATFIFSWTLTIRLFLKLDRERKELEAEINKQEELQQ